MSGCSGLGVGIFEVVLLFRVVGLWELWMGLWGFIMGCKSGVWGGVEGNPRGDFPQLVGRAL